MCLAVPAKLISCTGTNGLVDLHGSRVPINIVLVPDAMPGDWLLLHAGFAIQRMDENEVQLTWDVYDQLTDSGRMNDRTA